MYGIEWMEIHSSTYDEKVWLYTSLQCHLWHCSGSLSREYPLCQVLYRSPCNIASVLPELCVNLFDTALPPHDLYAGVINTALLPPNWQLFSWLLPCEPLSGNQLHASELGPCLGRAWSSLHVSSLYDHPCHQSLQNLLYDLFYYWSWQNSWYYPCLCQSWWDLS